VQTSPKKPAVAPPQQTSPKVKTLEKQSQAKSDGKKNSPIKGEQQSKRVGQSNQGKGYSKQKVKDTNSMELSLDPFYLAIASKSNIVDNKY